MSIAKCVGLLIILAVLFYLFIFNRRKMNQLSIAIAVTYVGLAVFRLWNQRADADTLEQIITIGIFLGGGVLLWAVLWGSQRWYARKSGGSARRDDSSSP